MKNKKTEFDDYIDNYREKQSEYLWLSGEDSKFFAEFKTQKLASWFPDLLFKRNKILDFGCGDGLMTNYIKETFSNSKLFGADISKDSILTAARIYPEIKFQHIENEKINFDNDYFDLVISAGVFHHIPKKEHSLWLAEIFRVLKPGGKIVIFELNPLNPVTNYIFRNHPMEKNAEMLWPWYAKGLCKKLGQSQIKFFTFFPKWFKYLRPLEPIMTWIPFGAHYAVVISKIT